MQINEITIQNPYGFIYITTNMLNGKRYLGQKKFDNNGNWKNYLGSGIALQNAVKKYGCENFSRNIICFCNSAEDLNKAEYELSIFLNVVEDDNWYNLCYGGISTNGFCMSNETKEKIGKHTKELWKNNEYRQKMISLFKTYVGENNPNYNNHKLTGENNPMYGKRHTEEAINKMRMSKIGKYNGENNPNYGNHWSDEVKEKIQKNQPNICNIVQLDCNYKLICEYKSLREATRITGFSRSNITNCCKHKTKQSHGFIWMFKKDYEEQQNDLKGE